VSTKPLGGGRLAAWDRAGQRPHISSSRVNGGSAQSQDAVLAGDLQFLVLLHEFGEENLAQAENARPLWRAEARVPGARLSMATQLNVDLPGPGWEEPLGSAAADANTTRAAVRGRHGKRLVLR
jgi:hypothetical protein